MDDARLRLYYDFIDPLSYLQAVELREVPGLDAEAVAWHPFELRPPPTPLVALDDPSLSERWASARSLGAERDLSFAPPSLVPWTRKAHELVLYAVEHDLASRVRERVFAAYLLEGADIGRVDVLVELAVGLGLDRVETRAVLDVDRHEAAVGTLRSDASAAGVSDTPALAIEGRTAQGFHNRDRIGTLLGT